MIYTKGEIEGLGDHATVFNYHPVLVERAIYSSGAKGTSSAPACETSIWTDRLAGASHGVPL